jgi:hypothetical protein
MKQTTSIAKALKIARAAVSMPEKIPGAFRLTGPYRADRPDGARTEKTVASYATAQRIRAAWIAEIALVALGCDPEQAQYESQDCLETGKRPEQVVDTWIKRA